jgi:hypothetical protein
MGYNGISVAEATTVPVPFATPNPVAGSKRTSCLYVALSGCITGIKAVNVAVVLDMTIVLRGFCETAFRKLQWTSSDRVSVDHRCPWEVFKAIK